MDIIIGILFVAVIGYLLIQKRKPDVANKITEEVKTVEAKVEAVAVEEIKAVEAVVVEEIKKTATKVKTAAKKAPALAVDGHGDVQEIKPAKKPAAKKKSAE
jgi:hypothetical protein